MSSLWTPQGEHRVPPNESTGTPPGSGAGGPPAGEPPPGSGAGSPGGDPGRSSAAEAGAGPEPDDEETLAGLNELRTQLLAAPVEDVVANHAYGLFELAALHLSNQPPALPAAQLAIDALAGIVDKLGDRLGRHAPALRDGLAQIRLAYVKIAEEAAPTDGASAAKPPEEG